MEAVGSPAPAPGPVPAPPPLLCKARRPGWPLASGLGPRGSACFLKKLPQEAELPHFLCSQNWQGAQPKPLAFQAAWASGRAQAACDPGQAPALPHLFPQPPSGTQEPASAPHTPTPPPAPFPPPVPELPERSLQHLCGLVCTRLSQRLRLVPSMAPDPGSVQGAEGRVGASTPRLPAGPLPPTSNTSPGPESLVQLLG